jgi:pimeloyl-ACP methyl ester carboxylesterase
MQRKYAQTEYGKISYLDRDKGYPLIFLHGFGGTGNTWLKIEPLLDAGIRPILVDLLGHGHSDKPEIDYRITQQAEAIKSLIEDLDLENFSIAGNSYGGWIALKFASTIINPDMIFLVDSAGISPTPGEQGIKTAGDFIDSILKVRNYKNRDALETIMKNNAREDEKITYDELAAIRCPTTVIWGRDDRVIPLEYGERLNAGIKGSQLIVIDGAGHTPQIDRPVEFANIINKKVLI